MAITNSDLIEQYSSLHSSKDYGVTGHYFWPHIQACIIDLKPDSLLEYGCGQSSLVDELDYEDAVYNRYDPAIPKFSEINVQNVDFIINTDVLEHIPEDDLGDVLKHMNSLSANVFFNIATGPAKHILPNGQNAHCTIWTADKWLAKIQEYFPDANLCYVKDGKNCLIIIGVGGVGMMGLQIAKAAFNCKPIVVDVDEEKVAKLNKGVIPIYEPGLESVVKTNFKAGNLRFTTNAEEAVKHAKIQFIAVGTPPDEDGSADLQYVLKVAETVARYMEDEKIIIDKSTVPVGFTDGIKLFAGSVSVIALLVAGIGIMNIMLVSVTERIKEIGIRKAIGATKRDILSQFLMEAIFLSQFGGVVGVILGVAGGNLVAVLLKVPAVIPMDWAFYGMAVCSFIGIGFGIYPAYRAANLDPIESLRFE